MEPLIEGHAIESMDKIVVKLNSYQQHKKDCEDFLYSWEYYKANIKKKEIRAIIDKHLALVSKQTTALKGFQDPVLVGGKVAQPNLRTTHSMRKHAKQLWDSYDKYSDIDKKHQKDGWEVEQLFEQSQILVKFYQDEISFIQSKSVKQLMGNAVLNICCLECTA